MKDIWYCFSFSFSSSISAVYETVWQGRHKAGLGWRLKSSFNQILLWAERPSMLDIFLNIGQLYHWFIEMFNQIAFWRGFLNNKWKIYYFYLIKKCHWSVSVFAWLALSSVWEWFVSSNISVINSFSPAMQSPTLLLTSQSIVAGFL